MAEMLKVSDLHVYYGSIHAVKGDSFAVQNLEITVSGLSAHRVSSVTVRQCGRCLACAQ